MKERPILFSGPMVRAILSGQKTQTRRAVKAPGWAPGSGDYTGRMQLGLSADGRVGLQAYFEHRETATWHGVRCPYGQPGDRLWVRETWMDLQGTGVEHRDRDGKRQRYAYGADTPPGSHGDECRKDFGLKWRPSIHMPRAASRITLEVTGVRVERLQDISEADAIAEGLQRTAGGSWLPGPCDHPEWAYHQLWDQINGPGAWDANPWVWVVEFKHLVSCAS